MRSILTICLTVFTLSSFGQRAFPEDWISYRNKGFTLSYPDSLQLNDTIGTMVQFMVLWPRTAPKDIFQENINMLIQDFSTEKGKLDLQTYVDISVNQIETQLTDGRVLENEPAAINGKVYQRLVYSGTQGIYHFKWLQYCHVSKRKAYLLTFTCEEMYFDEMAPVADQIMQSFDFR